jgi:hypothetical protein
VFIVVKTDRLGLEHLATNLERKRMDLTHLANRLKGYTIEETYYIEGKPYYSLVKHGDTPVFISMDLYHQSVNGDLNLEKEIPSSFKLFPKR